MPEGDFGASEGRPGSGEELRSLAGNQSIGTAFGRQLLIAGERIWKGDAVAIPTRREAGVDGLLPLNLFKMLYISNSAGYVSFAKNSVAGRLTRGEFGDSLTPSY